MSYIHEALNKAQKERDVRDGDYSGVLSARRVRKGFFQRRPILWMSLLLILVFLAFASYSWLGFRVKQSPVTSERTYKMPGTTSRSVAAVESGKSTAAPTRPSAAAKSGPNRAATSQPKRLLDAKNSYERGKIYHKKGRLQDAKRLYRETLRIDPGHVDALNNLAVIYLHEKNFPAAQRSFEKAIRLRPENVDPHYNLACLYSLKGEITKSLAHLRRALELDKSAIQWALKDSDLDNVRGNPGFESIVSKE
jgi:tetratricopeptide (TPR) repeat protein